MPYGGLYVWSIAVVGSPVAAFVGFYVVGLLAQDWMVAAVAGVAGLIAGLVVGFVDAAYMDAEDRRSVEAERSPDATRYEAPSGSSDDGDADEEELEELDEWDWAIEAVFDEAKREDRDLLPAEEREVERLVALQNKARGAELGIGWTALALLLAIFLGGPIAALVTALVVGWFLGG